VAAAYGTETVEKLSISLPPGLAARARSEADRGGTSLSAVVASALRDRFEREDHAFFDRARNTYLARARVEPGRVKIIDASGDQVQIRKEIAQHLKF